MVVMVTSRARSLHDPTQQDFIHACTLPIYNCHMQFKFWRTLQRTLCEIVYNQEGTQKMKRVIIFWEMRDISMSFMPIIPKIFTPYNSWSVCLGTQFNLPKTTGNNTIFHSKRCDTFCRDCISLEACLPRNTRDAYD